MSRLAAALALLLVTACPSSAAEWMRVETPNFVVYGEGGEKRTRELAQEFERFREALARVLPAARMRAAVPTIVVIFDTAKSFEPYRPIFNGKRVQLGGFFRGSEHENLVALSTENRVAALRTIFHEYTHLVFANVLPAVPAWLSEGLADYYSTFEVRDDGRTALLGNVVKVHMWLLKTGTTQLMPMEQLLAVTHESPIYNEGDGRSLFYAQSWALVHYLLTHSPEGTAQLARYAEITSAGSDPVVAWREVFGQLDPRDALLRYVRQFGLNGFEFTFDTAIAPVPPLVSRPGAEEVDATLANLLTRGGLGLEAEARFEKAIAVGGAATRAKALLGMGRAAAGQTDEALEPLIAASGDADWLTAYYAAVGLARAAETADDEKRGRVIEAAARALATVLTARPLLPHALALRAQVAYAAGGAVAGAIADVRSARELAPGRDDYAFLEARLLARDARFAEARTLLGPLLLPSVAATVRQEARVAMGHVVAMEREAAARAEQAVSRGILRDLDEPTLPVAQERVSEPVYRIMQPGEQRTEGLLERVECGARGVTLHVRADQRVLRFAAARLQAVQFISYRSEIPAPLPCSPRTPPDRVFLTWRPLSPARAGIAGRAVAVEFLASDAPQLPES